MKKYSRFLFAAIAFILVALITFVAANARQSNSNEKHSRNSSALLEEWNLYKNEQYNFAIKYPARATVEEKSIDNNEDTTVTPQLLAVKFFSPEAAPDAIMPEGSAAKKFEENYLFVYLQIYGNFQNLSSKEALGKIFATPGINPEKPVFEFLEVDLQPLKNGPENALVFVGSIGENPRKSVYFTHKDNFFMVTLFGSGGTGGDYSTTAEADFDFMISSLELLE